MTRWRWTARRVRAYTCGLVLSLMGVLMAIGIWWGFFPPGTSDSIIPFANIYLLGGAGFIYGLWVGDEVPRLRRNLPLILAITALALIAFAGSWWVQERREARLQQPLENPR